MKSQSSKIGNCKICGIQTRSLGFRVFVCKACAMFYRRSFQIRSHLQCVGNGNCQLTGNYRSNCRSCRMKMCREIGLRMVNSSLVVQHNGYPIDDVFDEEPKSVTPQQHQQSSSNMVYQSHFDLNAYSTPVHSSSSSCSSSIPIEPIIYEPICPLINANSFAHYPLLAKVASHFNRFENRQQSLVKSFRNQDEFVAKHSILIDNATYLRIESGNLHLMCIAVGEIFRDYCDLKSKEWLKFIRTTVIQLSLIHKLGLAVRQFPKSNDPRIACFIGAHSDSNDLQSHLGQYYESRKSYVEPMWNTWIGCMQRFREIAPTIEESLILSLSYILEEADRQHFLTFEATQFKNSIYSEFYGFLSEMHGPIKSPIRLIQLVALQMDAKKLYEEYNQMWQLLRVFKPNTEFSGYLWHERVNDEDLNFLAEYQNIASELSNL